MSETDSARLRVSRLLETRVVGIRGSDLAADVIAGFGRVPRSLPPKYFYDQRGAALFDAICDTPEYYPTRTEQALLEAAASDIIAANEPTHLVELGSGAARKTRILLEALHSAAGPAGTVEYVPVDISEEMLVSSARTLLAEYKWLRVHGVVADYDYHLGHLPRAGRRLIAFLGSTIGNFSRPSAVRFVESIASGMGAEDALLIGFDLIKSPAVLRAAYNDAAGVTAAFNLNVLNVLNSKLGGDFVLDGFEHVARYLEEEAQIEMSLRSRRAQRVTFAELGRGYQFAAGEMLRTEISRKFDRSRAEALVAAAGLEATAWHASPDNYVGLLTARQSR